MHPEQVEAIVQGVIEKTLGNTETLHDLHLVLKKANANTQRPGDSVDTLNAGLFHSLFLSHVRLAQMVSDIVGAHTQLQDRVEQLEKAIPAIQEAVINLQIRIKTLESET